MSSPQKAWSYQCDCRLKNSDNGKMHVKFIKTNKYAFKTFLDIFKAMKLELMAEEDKLKNKKERFQIKYEI